MYTPARPFALHEAETTPVLVLPVLMLVLPVPHHVLACLLERHRHLLGRHHTSMPQW